MNIYIDCSRIYTFGGNHGIPRVVRNIINNSQSTIDYKIVPVILSFGKLREVKSVAYKSESILNFLKKIKNIFIKSSSKISDTEKTTNSSSIIYNLFTLPTIFNRSVLPQKGDVFVVLDSFLMSVFPKNIKSYKNNGVIICSLHHDLIPIRYSQFYPKENVLNFKIYLENSLKLSDICITVSDYVKSDLKNYIDQNIKTNKEINKNILIESYRHGFDISNNQNMTPSYKRFEKIFEKPSYIIVSTIEPRKGHSYLLNAFEKIWQSGTNVNLLIIGRIGWMVDDLIERIRDHQQFEKRLFMLNNIPDSELLYCYKKAKALITTSVTEGFGLPIIEALSQKTPVLASNIEVFKEVGNEYCNYFDLSSSDSLSKLIIDWEKTGRKPRSKNIEGFKWPTWK